MTVSSTAKLARRASRPGKSGVDADRSSDGHETDRSDARMCPRAPRRTGLSSGAPYPSSGRAGDCRPAREPRPPGEIGPLSRQSATASAVPQLHSGQADQGHAATGMRELNGGPETLRNGHGSAPAGADGEPRGGVAQQAAAGPLCRHE